MFTPHVPFSVTIASGATLSSAITIPISRNHFHLEVPTMASGTDVYIQASIDGTNFRRVVYTPTLTNAAPGPIYLTSAITNCFVNIDILSPEYLKIELSTAMTATSAVFKVVIS